MKCWLTDALYHVLFFWVIATLASNMPAANGRKCIKITEQVLGVPMKFRKQKSIIAEWYFSSLLFMIIETMKAITVA